MVAHIRQWLSQISDADPRRAARIAAFAARRAADDADRQTKLGTLLLEAASGQRIVSDSKRGDRIVSLSLGDVVDRVTLAMARGATPDDVTRLVASEDLGPLGWRADWTELRGALHAIARERGINVADVDHAFQVDGLRAYVAPDEPTAPASDVATDAPTAPVSDALAAR
jgi:hypothetical protein